MAIITIKDLNLSKELDRKALRSLTGGHGSWGYEYGFSYEFTRGPHGFSESYHEYSYGFEFGGHGHGHGHRCRRRRPWRRRRRARRKAA